MSPSSKDFDAETFWQAHDRALEEHSDLTSAGAVLSHDLYRGMPAWFNAYFAAFQRIALERLLRQCSVKPGQRALDVGCGTGRWSGWLIQHGMTVSGFDVGERTVRMAAAREPSAQFCCAALPVLCYAPQVFELAVSVTVLQHLPFDRQPQAIAAIGTALKPGGHLLVCELTDIQDSSPHIFAHSAAEWDKLFEQHGLRLVKRIGCEYLPFVKGFHLARRGMQIWRPRHMQPEIAVGMVALGLKQHPIFAWLVRLILMFAYPVESLAMSILPPHWARLTCFLLQKI